MSRETKEESGIAKEPVGRPKRDRIQCGAERAAGRSVAR